MDNLGDIRLFVEAANLGSLSAAGRKLGLSPAAASARLVKLEGALGTQLFERTTRKLRLTDEGGIYLAHCQHALQTLDDAHAALHAGRATVSGRLRVSATSDFWTPCGQAVAGRVQRLTSGRQYLAHALGLNFASSPR